MFHCGGVVENCVIAFNSADIGGEVAHNGGLYNSIVAFNTATQGALSSQITTGTGIST